MDRERLRSLQIESLQDLARRSGIANVDDIDRSSLIEQILEVFEEERIDRERSNNIEMLVKEKKFELNPDDSLEYPDFEEYELPDSYQETRIVLMLRDPEWAFTYWDLSPAHRNLIDEEPESSTLLLRIYVSESAGSSGQPSTQVDEFFDIPVSAKERRWYVNLPTPGKSYRVALVHQTPTQTSTLCESGIVDSPPVTIDEIESADSGGYVDILSVAGIREVDDPDLQNGIPQRIISLLDTQYLHLKG